MPLLIAASYLFYATWSLPFIGIILITTTLDYWMAKIIERSDEPRTRKAALITGLVINLVILGFFKYCNFFLDNAAGLAHMFGWDNPLPTAINIILPLGISFYTFEAISYLVDVYRGNAAAPNWLSYNFYIMYFPHLISGPIVRFGELWPQYAKPLRLPNSERILKGVELMLLGFAFKILIADRVAPMADMVFHASKVSALMTYWGVLAFTVQIYFDFMGYTHIARGASLLMNIEMPLNFNHPYLAGNVSEFWNRWHMSLSRWIRDYLFIPLGGSHGTLLQTVYNLLVTMLICGAWHGAGWTYIVWGGYHGVLLALYQVYKRVKTKLPSLGNALDRAWALPGLHLVPVLFTFFLVMIGWVFFRTTSLEQALRIVGRLFHFDGVGKGIAQSVAAGDVTLLVQFAFLLAACFAGPWVVRGLAGWFRPMPYWGKAAVGAALFVLGVVLTAGDAPPFLYFQF